jgi:hypothetical protein
MSDYLWDKTGEPEEDVEQLENLLGALKYQTRPLDIPLSAMPKAATRPAWMSFSRPQLAIAASLLLMLLAGIWFVTRQGETQKNELAKGKQGSEAVGSRQPENAFATNDTKTDDNDSINNAPGKHDEVNNADAPKPREDRARIVSVSAPKTQRSTRGLLAGRQKLQPRRSVGDAPATREEIAVNGTRWEIEQPLTPQQRDATEKLMLALQVASAKFNYAQREMREIGRAGK